MYEWIKGTLVEKDPLRAIVETHGLGYRLRIPLSTYTSLPPLQSSVMLYLSHIVREDVEDLYAFLTREERDLFETVITISGIGPKTGLAIIGHLPIAALQQAIATSDIRLLSKIPGIGKKTAERLIVEMRDKFKGKGAKHLEENGNLMGDALSALMNLGYGPLDAQKAIATVMKTKPDETDLSRLIAAALQNI